MREMKDSGVEWIGEIPKEWNTIRLKYLLTNKKNSIKVGPFGSQIKGNDFVDEGVPVYTQRTVLDDDFINGDAFITKEKYSLLKGFEVEPLDFLITTRGSIGRVAIAPEDVRPGIIHPCIIKFTIDRNIYNEHLLKYIFNGSDIILEQLVLASNATTIPVVYSEPLKNVIIPIAPYNQQQKIVRYLNEEFTKINAVIKKQQAIIEKLKEYKLSIITEAVIRGLDKKIELKDSGNKYLGQVPIHWSVVKFGRIATIKSNLVSPVEYQDYPQISPDNIDKGSGKLLGYNTVEESGVISWNHLFYTGQIIYSKIRPLLDKVIIAPFDGLCSADMYPIETDCNKFFIVFVILSAYFHAQVALVTETRVKMPKINQNELSSIVVAIPPVKEQNQIAEYLKHKCRKVDKIIEQRGKIIETLQKYKKSIVYEVVTGKREVL